MQKEPSNLVPTSPGCALVAPAWAVALASKRVSSTRDGRLDVTTFAGPAFSLVSVSVADADSLSADELAEATTAAYTAIAQQLAGQSASHPVRFWNYIPDIHRASGTSAEPHLDRYMVFNAGRYTACQAWLGGEDAFAKLLATASGVGHSGADLVVHALAASKPGVAVENPRQVPAYRYSRRYGPKPPCFARATVIDHPDGRRRVLVGGTASVRGEASVHIGELAGQVDETVENLNALLAAARVGADDVSFLSDVRVYYVNPADLAALRSRCGSAFPNADVEYVHSDLCRQDLLVEIEGVAAGA